MKPCTATASNISGRSRLDADRRLSDERLGPILSRPMELPHDAHCQPTEPQLGTRGATRVCEVCGGWVPCKCARYEAVVVHHRVRARYQPSHSRVQGACAWYVPFKCFSTRWWWYNVKVVHGTSDVVIVVMHKVVHCLHMLNQGVHILCTRYLTFCTC